jgi:hypothetical protein
MIGKKNQIMNEELVLKQVKKFVIEFYMKQ